LSAAQQAALEASVERGRAQYRAGEAISGDAVSLWLNSWGIDHELPPPARKQRGG
jgi:predicted transcriptional regulator